MFINSERPIPPIDHIASNVKLARTSVVFLFCFVFLKQLPVPFRCKKYFLSILVGKGKLRIAV